MSRRLRVAVAVLTVAVLPLGAARALAAEEGQKIYKDTCAQCHSEQTRPLKGKQMTREQWKEAIDKMAGLGAELPSKKKIEVLIDYFVKHNGPESN